MRIITALSYDYNKKCHTNQTSLLYISFLSYSITCKGGFIMTTVTGDNNINVITTEKLRHILGIGRDRAYALMRSPGFPSTKLGKTYFITNDKLNKWLETYAGREYHL